MNHTHHSTEAYSLSILLLRHATAVEMHEQIKIIFPSPFSASPLPIAFFRFKDGSAVRLLLIVIRFACFIIATSIREPGKGHPIARALLYNCVQTCTVLDIFFEI